jgi:hypothetical protein
MLSTPQELMTPHEAARWFRRSPSWLRSQPNLLRVGGPGQPLYHVCVCRAYILARLCGLSAAELRRVQLKALAATCGLADSGEILGAEAAGPPTDEAAQQQQAQPTT